MPYLETPEELAEDLADQVGVYGTGTETGGHPEGCPCRICWVMGIVQRMRQAVAWEQRLAQVEAHAALDQYLKGPR